MRKDNKLNQFYFGLFIIGFSGTVFANMRAAIIYPKAPSSFLSKSASDKNVKNLVVKKEQLTLDCSYEDCKVNAVYYIEAESGNLLQFKFILPVNVKVDVNVNGINSDAVLSKTSYKVANIHDVEEGMEAYKAVFLGQLNKGNNFIQVRYEQALGLFERAYGYFTQSRSIEKFTYVLSPLKEWKLAPDFSLDITLSTPKSRPDRDGWSFFKRRSVLCNLLGGQIVKKGNRIFYHNKLDKNFPDMLVCHMGDKDLLKIYDY